MNIRIYKSKGEGEVQAPPSKSMAHRLLICGGLSGNQATVQNIAMSKDIEATLGCLKGMGAVFTVDGDAVCFHKSVSFGAYRDILNCNESGSTLRFFIPLALVDGVKTKFIGKGRLMSRPMTVYEDICKKEGIYYEGNENGIAVEGKLKGGKYTVPGDISSQFITGLMFALPLISGGEIEITGKIESRSYINLTISAMNKAGIGAVWKNENTLYIPKGDYKLTAETVEGDYSNAAFMEGLNYLGSKVKVTGLSDDTMQGDAVYREYFKKMSKGNCTLDITDCPDLGPVLMALGGALHGVTLTGTARLKIKESDRAEVMKDVLKSFSLDCTVEENRVIIPKGQIKTPAHPVDGYNDHRIVMSTALLMTLTGGEIQGSEAVNKSYPDFFERLGELGIKLEYISKEDE